MGNSDSDTQQAVSRRLPTGTVVFLFTDVEGSTRRWESDQVKMSRALQLHDETLRFAIESHGGYVFKTVGDGFCAAFDRLTDAAFAAQTVLRQLGSNAFDDVGKLGVRIAIHVGEAYERDGDYFGPTVNRVARLLQIGHPGQIILSAAAAESLRTNPPANIELKLLDEHRLKDLAQPELVFQLIAPDLRADFPPLRSLRTTGDNNLPLQSGALVGREHAVTEIHRLLQTNRLVTLTGSGGIGKTRISLQVAAELLEESPDGVWFVDLAPITDPSLVANVISNTLKLQLSRDRDPGESLSKSLENRRMLIVLDNCEHVIAAAAAMSELMLRRCANVRLLATSREPLNIAGESVYWIPSLEVPPEHFSGGPNEAVRYGSVMLFVERARSADPRFTLTDETAPQVGEICRRLDGIALAIELAAARTLFLTPRELALQLDKRFAVLTNGRRTVLRRQQTLRAAIDWSFDLLGEVEKVLFRRLAIFSDGWTMEAAESICADDVLVPADVLETLYLLVQKSLVNAAPQASGNRFRFLESTRIYALERLCDDLERDRLAQKHLLWVLHLAETAWETRGRIPLASWLSKIQPELENIREALRFAQFFELKPILAGRIVGALAPYWYLAGLLNEGRSRIEAALTRLDEEDDATVVARLRLGLAQLTPTKIGRDSALRAIAIYKRLANWQGLARGEGCLAWVLWQIGDLPLAESAALRALSISREHDDANEYDYACYLDTYATILMSTGRETAARASFHEVASILRQLGEDEGAAISRFNLAELEFAAGNVDFALILVSEAIDALRRLGSWGRLAIALTNAAGYKVALDQIEDARETASEVLLLGKRFQVEVVASAIEHLGAVAAKRGDAARAVSLLGYVDAAYKTVNLERGATERFSQNIIANAAASALDAKTISRLRSEGATMTEDTAIAVALRE